MVANEYFRTVELATGAATLEQSVGSPGGDRADKHRAQFSRVLTRESLRFESNMDLMLASCPSSTVHAREYGMRLGAVYRVGWLAGWLSGSCSRDLTLGLRSLDTPSSRDIEGPRLFEGKASTLNPAGLRATLRMARGDSLALDTKRVLTLGRFGGRIEKLVVCVSACLRVCVSACISILFVG